MSPSISQRAARIPPSGIRKFFDIAATMDDVISLSIGEPDFDTPAHICEAGIASLQAGKTHYTSNSGMLELRQAIADDLRRLYGVAYDPKDEIIITVGASEALYLSMMALLDAGEEVIVPEPCFVAYAPEVELAGGVARRISTSVQEGFQVRTEDIRAALSPRTKAILIGNPNNPTGTVISRPRMLEIAGLAQERDLIVISDEIYARLVYGVEHVCCAALPGMRERTILLNGFSKAYAMTGWRIGYVAGPRELIAPMLRVHQYTIMCAGTTPQIAALRALQAGDPDVEYMHEIYARRRQRIVSGLNAMGLTCFEPGGAFYAFPSIQSTGLTSAEFCERLLREEKVAVVPGSAFGACGEGYIRCSYAASFENIEEALRRMGRFVQKVRG